MTAIAKSAKTHPAAKKCCGWEEPALFRTVCACGCEINTSLGAKRALTHRMHRRTACNSAPPAKSKMGARGS